MQAYEKENGDVVIVNSKGTFLYDVEGNVTVVDSAAIEDAVQIDIDDVDVPDELFECDCDNGAIIETCSLCNGSGERNYGPVGGCCSACGGSGEKVVECSRCAGRK